jgi:hypothetical protein
MAVGVAVKYRSRSDDDSGRKTSDRRAGTQANVSVDDAGAGVGDRRAREDAEARQVLSAYARRGRDSECK